MTRQIACPGCGEQEELRGSRTDDGIVITCGVCQASWLQDSIPERCATCDGTDIETRPQALTQYARGTQLSIVGWRHSPFCAVCDADMLARVQWGKPVPSHYISAAAKPRSGGAGSTSQILPR